MLPSLHTTGSEKKMYRYEENLVEDFTQLISDLKNPFSIEGFAFEFFFVSGRTDIIGRSHDGSLFCFEAKLTKWKKALNQAYRNTAFAHYSYVVLPEKTAENARKHEIEFKRRKVGLCYIKNNGIDVEIPAKKTTPLQPWLTRNAFEHIKMNYSYG